MTRGKRGAPAGRDPRDLVEGWAGDPGLSGSARGEFTLVLANQLCGALWGGADPDPRLLEVQQAAALQALRGIAPRDPVEGMLAAQMVATHDAAMECHRRASHPGQTPAGRDLALRHAGKLVRSYAALVEALGRHRGKGQQTVRVEHVTVQAGGRAIVGTVGRGAGCVENGGTAPCKAARPCTGARAAGRGPGAGARAARPR